MSKQDPAEPVAAYWAPRQAAARLTASPIQWCVIGGWAIDLWLGFESRCHGDLEISIPRADFPALSTLLADLTPFAIKDGEISELEGGVPLPMGCHQARFLDADEHAWRLDVMVDPGDADMWVYRRDERLRCSRSSLAARRDSIPYMKPEVVLLFKAKASRLKDQHDFELCLEHLAPEAAAWLAECLGRFHPGHAWITPLRKALPQRAAGIEPR